MPHLNIINHKCVMFRVLYISFTTADVPFRVCIVFSGCPRFVYVLYLQDVPYRVCIVFTGCPVSCMYCIYRSSRIVYVLYLQDVPFNVCIVFYRMSRFMYV